MLTVTLFTRPGCHLCEQAKADLEALQDIVPHHLVELDIEQDEALLKAYSFEIPVVKVGPYTVKAPFDRQRLQITLGAANDRMKQLEKIGHKSHMDRVERGKRISGADRFTYWISRHYLFDQPRNIDICWFANLSTCSDEIRLRNTRNCYL